MIGMTEETKILISVAIVTRNRPASLERCLQSWRRQTVAPYEIVVSDDSDDSDAGKTMELAERYGCVYTRGPCRGLYANRNHASLACTGTHILSADDDHTHPVDFFDSVLNTARRSPIRVWTFAQRPANIPDLPIGTPPELHRSGAGKTPTNQFNSTAIADGASLFPRAIFDSGLRYDEAYPFGAMWLLWGKQIARQGWRISYAGDCTFHWHHEEHEGRVLDKGAVRKHLETINYAIVVNLLYYERTMETAVFTAYYLLARMILPYSVTGYSVSSRLSLGDTARLLRKVFDPRSCHRASTWRKKAEARLSPDAAGERSHGKSTGLLAAQNIKPSL